MYNNKPVVIVVYDPQNPEINNQNKRRLNTDSKLGKVYSCLVSEYLRLRVEYKECLKIWSETYKGRPERYTFPLRKQITDAFSYSDFADAVPNQNDYPVKTPYVYKGQVFRSKNEIIAVQQLEQMGYEWKTEIKLQFGQYIFYPDATFYIPHIQKVMALEIDGLMEKYNYFLKSEHRKDKYFKAGIRENLDVLFYRMSSENDFNVGMFRRQVEMAIELNAEMIKSPFLAKSMV